NDSEKVTKIASPAMVGIEDNSLRDLLNRLMELYSRKEVLSASVQEKNPTYINLQNEIRVTRNALEESVKNQLSTAESVLASSKDRYRTIENRLLRLPETEKDLIEKQREFNLNNELYTFL